MSVHNNRRCEPSIWLRCNLLHCYCWNNKFHVMLCYVSWSSSLISLMWNACSNLHICAPSLRFPFFHTTMNALVYYVCTLYLSFFLLIVLYTVASAFLTHLPTHTERYRMWVVFIYYIFSFIYTYKRSILFRSAGQNQ